jgi:hypothetical protein
MDTRVIDFVVSAGFNQPLRVQDLTDAARPVPFAITGQGVWSWSGVDIWVTMSRVERKE